MRLKKLLAALFAAMFLMSGAPSALAANVSNDDVGEYMITLTKYIEVDESTGTAKFDTETAKADGLSEESIQIGQEVNRIYSPENAIATRLAFAFHGNWCGPGHSGPGAPVDNLDELCKRHDECYARTEQHKCDVELMHQLKINFKKFSLTNKARALAMTAVFASKYGAEELARWFKK
ncbi:phospholipase A2 family protein [Devriesea agamarum]|uniref:phospholipase A2 family protein n=1 Tax=Devriesea agamarum TaxID=472569 RepID=UPI00071D228A|nr:phospholipase A2 family protein [Devriesea agamarum]